jgi:hypothetical protein
MGTHNQKNMKIIQMNPEPLKIARLYLEKVEKLTGTERILFTDLLRFYVYPIKVAKHLTKIHK